MTKTIGTIATQYARLEGLIAVCASISTQLDELHVYANDYPVDFNKEVLPYHNKVTMHIGADKFGDMADNGKFFLPLDDDSFRLTFDDDIHYPFNYVKETVASLKNIGIKSVISYHGSILRQPVVSYYKDREVFRHNATLTSLKSVHIIGTGCACYHSAAVKYSVEHWLNSPRYMSDIVFSAMCNEQLVRRYVIPHNGVFLKQNGKIARLNSIMLTQKDNDSCQSEYVQKINWWR